MALKGSGQGVATGGGTLEPGDDQQGAAKHCPLSEFSLDVT